MSDPTYPLFPLFSFLSFLLVLAPFPWHFQAWNAGTCTYMFWTALACLNQFINSVVWKGNTRDVAPVWCDISSRLMVGSSVALPAATLCIIRRLYKIATSSDVVVDSRAKRRAVYEDVGIGCGIPILQMALQIIVNGHRYNILEDIGCFPVTINVWLAYPLVTTWPLIIGLVSAVYCVLTFRAFHLRDSQLKALLSPLSSPSSSPFSTPPYSPSSSATSSPTSPSSALRLSSFISHRYFRLMLLCVVSLLLTTPLAAYTLYLNLSSTRIVPYRGWDDLHWGYSRVDKIPAVIWSGALGVNGSIAVGIEMSRWLSVVCAVVFFTFFGLAEEARKGYDRVWFRINNLWRRLRGKESSPYGRHLIDLERGHSPRPRPSPIQVMLVPSHEACMTPSTLRSGPQVSSETLVNGGDYEKKWGSESWRCHGRSLSFGRGYNGPDRPSLEAAVRMMDNLQPLKKVVSSPR